MTKWVQIELSTPPCKLIRGSDMSKYRIVKIGSAYDVQRKYFLFGWSSVVPRFWSKALFTIADAERMLAAVRRRDEDKPEVVKEYRFND